LPGRVRDDNTFPPVILLLGHRFNHETKLPAFGNFETSQIKKENTKPVVEVVPYEDGWPEYDEPVFDF
jgi:hypothetical protein